MKHYKQSWNVKSDIQTIGNIDSKDMKRYYKINTLLGRIMFSAFGTKLVLSLVYETTLTKQDNNSNSILKFRTSEFTQESKNEK